MAEDVKTVLTHTVNTISNLTDVVKDLKLTVYDYNIKPLKDPGLYTAFEVTATDTKKTQKITVLADGDTFGATSSDIGDYDVVVDWGDGTTTTKSSADFSWVYKNSAMTYYKHQFAAKRIDITYQHTYASNGTYKIKILGTTYYQFRCNTLSTNIISRCMLYDLPLYSGLTRLQGAFGSSKYLTKIDCPANYQWPDNVIDLAQMFQYCSNLLSVGNMVLPLGPLGLVGMFSYASKLKKGVHIPDSALNVRAMYLRCYLLTEIPNTGKNVRLMFWFAYDCWKLQSVGDSISKEVRMANGAFAQTYSLHVTPTFLEGIVWGNPDGLLVWKNDGNPHNAAEGLQGVFNGSGIINAPQNMGTCYQQANVSANNMFMGCKNMLSLPVLPEGIVSCQSVFRGCSSAKTVHKTGDVVDVLPAGVTNIYYACLGCSELQQLINIPTSVLNAGGCFKGCKSLVYVTPFQSGVTYSVTDISNMFALCYGLTAMSSQIPASVTDMSYFMYRCYNMKTFYGATNTLLNTATSLANMNYAFYDCKSLLKLGSTIPNTVITADYAFLGCSKATILPKFNTSESLCTSANSIYSGCLSVTINSESDYYIRLPKNITTATAFCSGCLNLLMNVSKLIPTALTGNNIDVSNMCYSCKKLYGTLTLINNLGMKLWNSGKTFINYSNAFKNCSNTIRIYIPTTWGGLKEI